jgi:hypothetical protein
VRVAFKEWGVVVDALGRGAQILLLRKGGIHEPRGGFRVDYRRFLLFPTRYHQQRDSVIAAAQARFDALCQLRLPAEVVRLEFGAELVEARRIESLAQAKALRGQHIWREDVIEGRFGWAKERTIHALAVRVFRLVRPVEVPLDPLYGGCKSWITLDRDIPTDEAAPVLSDSEFERKLTEFRGVLPRKKPGLSPPLLPT